MAKKRIKNKSRIEAKSENKVLHGLAGSIEEATYRLKNMALLDYITECYKNKKESQ